MKPKIALTAWTRIDHARGVRRGPRHTFHQTIVASTPQVAGRSRPAPLSGHPRCGPASRPFAQCSPARGLLGLYVSPLAPPPVPGRGRGALRRDLGRARARARQGTCRCARLRVTPAVIASDDFIAPIGVYADWRPDWRRSSRGERWWHSRSRGAERHVTRGPGESKMRTHMQRKGSSGKLRRRPSTSAPSTAGSRRPARRGARAGEGIGRCRLGWPISSEGTSPPRGGAGPAHRGPRRPSGSTRSADKVLSADRLDEPPVGHGPPGGRGDGWRAAGPGSSGEREVDGPRCVTRRRKSRTRSGERSRPPLR